MCLHMHDPREPHITYAKHILHYLQCTLDHDLPLRRDSTSEFVIYIDAETRRVVLTLIGPLPGQQPRLLVLEAPEHRLMFQC
jgi:hypothetical protein